MSSRSPGCRRLACLALVSIGLWLVLGAPAAGQQSPAPASGRPLEVLFIGNSFTYVNSLSELVAGIAGSRPAGPAIQPTMVATGGMTLQWHLAAGRAAALIESRPWDAVVLQEQSALGAGTEDGNTALSPPGIFHASVRRFVPLIRARGATPVLLMTWARRARPSDQDLLTNAYDTIGHELDVQVSPAGIAWERARRRWPTLELHLADGSHPNATGSYLAACVLYATLTGRSPIGATAVVSGHPYSRPLQALDPTQTVTLAQLPSSLARRLQTLAWAVVTETQRGRGKG